MKLTRGLSATETNPTLHECTWDELLTNLRNRAPFVGPKDGEWFCFSDFGGRQRSYDNLLGAHALVLDFDTHEPNWSVLDGYVYVAWTTYKNAPGAPRWRVVLPLASIANRYEYYATWQAWSDALGGADGAAKDATRLNYLPGACMHPEAAQMRVGAGNLSSVVAATVPEGTLKGGDEWTEAPRADWHGPTDDDPLIEIAKRSKSAPSTFGTKARFRDIWDLNARKLCDAYPADKNSRESWNASAVDQALANHLAFWTGRDCARMQRIMLTSPLFRPKYEREDYLRRTILEACRQPGSVYNDAKGIVAGAAAPVSGTGGGIELDDFYAYLPAHNYIFVPTREPWPAAGVDAAAPWPADKVKPSTWLDQARPVHQMTWAPGENLVINNRLVSGGGWIDREGAATFNLYLPPVITPGDPTQAEPWLQLLRFVYPNDADHIVKWFAQRRQQPNVKINHALVFGGKPGIGKDTIMEPLKRAVGPWNFKEVAPNNLLADFNPHVKSVVLRVSEARDSGDMSRFALYEHCKTLLASPPDVLRCNEKNLREHDVFNVLGAIFTTNHKDGLYLPNDDRRHYVTWSDREQREFTPDYWKQMWEWYEGGGCGHVVAYLDALDLSDFNPKAPPVKTPAFWEMVDAGRSPEEAPLADALDKLGQPRAASIDQVQEAANPDFRNWLRDPKNRKQIRHRFDTLGYSPVRNPTDKQDGLWRVNGKRQTVYARKELTEHDRLAAAAMTVTNR